MWPSRCWLANGHLGALIGIWWKLGPPRRDELRVEVGEQAALQQRIVAEVDARDDVGGADTPPARSRRRSCPASGPAPCGRSSCSGTSSSGISLVGSRWSNGNASASSSVNSCTPNSHSGKSPACDRLEQVAAVEVVVGALQLHRLVPHRRLQAELRAPVELAEGRAALRIEQPEAVDAEAFDHAQRARDRAVAHRPHDHVHAIRASAR